METAAFLEAIEADLEQLTIGEDDAAAARILGALRASLQLRLLDAMGDAALELNDQLPGGHVEVRLAGRDVELVYVGDEAAAPAPDDESGTARLTLRMPESLKTQVERVAAREGRSTNAWLVDAVQRGLRQRGRRQAGSRLSGFGSG